MPRPTSLFLPITTAFLLLVSVPAARAQSLYGFTEARPLTRESALAAGRHERPALASAGNDVWLATWESTRSLGGTIGRDADILVARSIDGGFSWSHPAPLNNDAALDLRDDRAPKLAGDGAGNWAALWTGRDAGLVEGEAAIWIARSSDNGLTWSAPAPLHASATTRADDARALSIAAGQGGALVAAWTSADSLGDAAGDDADVLFSRSLDSGSTWSAPAALNANAATDGASDDQPVLATDRAGNWVAIWSAAGVYGDAHGQDRDIFSATSADNGATWSAPAMVDASALSNEALEDESPILATDRNGRWTALWVQGRERTVAMARSLDNGATWTLDALAAPVASQPDAAPTTIDSIYYNECCPFVAGPLALLDGAGDGVALYQECLNRQRCVVSYGLVTCSDWEERVTPRGYRLSGSGEAPQGMANAASGASAIAFDEAANVWLAVREESGDLTAMRSLDKGATWSEAYPLNIDEPEVESGAADVTPDLASDGAGAMVAAWASSEWANGVGGERRIYLARTADNGATWSERVLASPEAPSSQANASAPVVATDGAGAWVAAFSAKHSLGGTVGIDYDILFVRSTDAGATWSATAALNGTAPGLTGDNSNPALAAGDAGTWIVLWSSANTLPGAPSEQGTRLHFARSTDGGATWSFPREAAAYPTGGGIQNDGRPAVAHGGNGVWTAAFTRSVTRFDYMWVRSVDDGETWSPAISFYSGVDGDHGVGDTPSIASDGAGTWVAAWATSWPYMISEGAEFDLVFVRSTDNGETWSDPRPLNATAGADGAPVAWWERNVSVAAGPGGVWMAAWSSEEKDGGQFRHFAMAARSLDGGATWSYPFRLSPVSPPILREANLTPALALGADGRWLAVWEGAHDAAAYGPDLDLYYAFSDNFAAAPESGAPAAFAAR